MKRLTWIVFVILSLPVFAQEREKAIAELEKSAAYFESNSGTEAFFTLREREKGSRETHSFDGVLKSKGNKFYISTPDVDTWFDGKTQWSYLKSNEEVNVTSPSAEEIESVNPVSLLRLYKKGFRVSYKGEKTLNGQKGAEIVLVPDKKGSQWTHIDLLIDCANHRPLSIAIQDKGGKTTEITFLKIADRLNLNDSIFVFNPKDYPEAEVIDLR